MKKLKLRLLSLLLILIFASAILCSCASKSYDAIAPGYAEDNASAGSTITSPESSKGEAIDTERKIIKTVNITAETKEFDKTIENINDMCAKIGGYIETSSISGNSINATYSSKHASFTLRIPAEKLDQFTGNVEDSVNVTNITSNSLEITESYYDAVARLAVLEVQRDSLQKMYDSFDDYSDMNDMLAVQDKLYDVIEEIESYQARLNSYDNKVEYSTVHINLREVVEYTAVNANREGFWTRIGDAFVAGWANFYIGCQDFAVWFIRNLPTLLIIAAIIWVLVIIIIKARKRIKPRKEKKPSSDNSEKTNAQEDNIN